MAMPAIAVIGLTYRVSKKRLLHEKWHKLIDNQKAQDEIPLY